MTDILKIIKKKIVCRSEKSKIISFCNKDNALLSRLLPYHVVDLLNCVIAHSFKVIFIDFNNFINGIYEKGLSNILEYYSLNNDIEEASIIKNIHNFQGSQIDFLSSNMETSNYRSDFLKRLLIFLKNRYDLIIINYPYNINSKNEFNNLNDLVDLNYLINSSDIDKDTIKNSDNNTRVFNMNNEELSEDSVLRRYYDNYRINNNLIFLNNSISKDNDLFNLSHFNWYLKVFSQIIGYIFDIQEQAMLDFISKAV
jgi:hypothetical protein